jgi:hypothetical protein
MKDVLKYEEFDNESVTAEIPSVKEEINGIKKDISEINSSLDNKANLNSIFNMANMGQDVKEAMTGGSVAVVGKNAVLTENIVNGQVTGEKTDFLINENLNLFKGTFLKGYLQGDDDNPAYTINQLANTIAVDVKPNTTYSVNKSKVGMEGGYYYFKVATFTKKVDEVLSEVEIAKTVFADGSHIDMSASTSTEHTHKKITTGANDKSVFITVGRELAPYVEVMEGDYSEMVYNSYTPIYGTINTTANKIADGIVDSTKIVKGSIPLTDLKGVEKSPYIYKPLTDYEVISNAYYDSNGHEIVTNNTSYEVWNVYAKEDMYIRFNNIFRVKMFNSFTPNRNTFVSNVGGQDNAGLQTLLLPKGCMLGISIKLGYDSPVLEYSQCIKIDNLVVNLEDSIGKIKNSQVDFIGETRVNLFDGDFKNLYLFGDAGTGYHLTSTAGYKTFVADIKPNTTYTILKDETPAEPNGYYYFKVATFIETKEELLTIMQGSSAHIVSGSICHTATYTDTTRFTFTSGENDNCIVVVLCKTPDVYAELLEGNFNSYQVNSYEPMLEFTEKVNVYNKQEVDAKILDLSNGIKANTFKKVGENCDILLNGYVGYRFGRRISSSINLDTWLLRNGTAKGITLWSETDIEAPIKEVGTSDFIGGIHGDEQYETVQILVDGVLLDMDANYDMTFNNLTIFVKSTLYRCNSTTPVFTRYKKLEFEGTELIVSNKLICLVDDFKVERHTGCGLFSMYKDLITGYTVNTEPSLVTDRGLGNNKDMDCGTFFGDGYSVTLKTLYGKTDSYIGSVADFDGESRPRFKMYFDCIKSSGSYVLMTNDILNTAFSIKIV